MPDEIEIPESERWLSVIGGSMLILTSLRRRGVWSGGLFAAGGSALIFRGIVGHDGLFEAIRTLLAGEPLGGFGEVPEAELEAELDRGTEA